MLSDTSCTAEGQGSDGPHRAGSGYKRCATIADAAHPAAGTGFEVAVKG